jgi:hypothetical protein
VGGDQGVRIQLTQEQRAIKQQMLGCFESQRDVLRWFGTDYECIRHAPEYNFAEPPHRGRLFYESYDWGLNAAEWLRLARRAERAIGKCLVGHV